jgi:hypothetical protein
MRPHFNGRSNPGGGVDDVGWQVGALAKGVAHKDDVVEILLSDFADLVVDYPISSISELSLGASAVQRLYSPDLPER